MDYKKEAMIKYSKQKGDIVREDKSKSVEEILKNLYIDGVGTCGMKTSMDEAKQSLYQLIVERLPKEKPMSTDFRDQGYNYGLKDSKQSLKDIFGIKGE